MITGGKSFALSLNSTTIWPILQEYSAPTTSDQIRSKQQIIDNFCEQSLNTKINKIFNKSNQRYLAENSLFLSLLCSQSNSTNFKFHSSITLNTTNNYLREKISLEMLKYPSKCSNVKDKIQTDCDLGELSTKLISDILSDLTTLKQAQIYGVLNNNFSDKKSIEENINIFAEQKLNIGGANNNETNFCSGTKHNYPKTCAQLQKNMKKFEKALNQLKIIDVKKLLNQASSKTKDQKICLKSAENPQNFDSLFCNLFSSLETEKALYPFINQIYNELLWYMLFSTYSHYNLSIQRDPTNQTLTELSYLKITPLNIITTTNLTLKQLAEIESTYAFHVGMLAYQEDLLWLRNNYLSKVVTPFYTLFYKVQDVQIQK